MKKYTILALAFVLTACLFTGCRSKQNNMTPTSTPTTMPTTQTTTAPTTAPTQASTAPSTAATQPSETIDFGNGPRDDSASGEATMPEGRGRQADSGTN